MDGFPVATPFLKWAGSKRRLLDQIRGLIPTSFGKYFEPFLGGGALFFALSPPRAEISDSCEALIETYKAVRRDPHGIFEFVSVLHPTRNNFERVKSTLFRGEISRAGAFIFLNKTCWNGLYRVNSSGKFNVPYGQPRSNYITDIVTLEDCSKALRRRGVAIRRQDFSSIEARAEEGDFVFFDPPYVTNHNKNGFVDWNEKLFSWEDQRRLAALARRLARKGVNVLVTNADHQSLHDLYNGFQSAQLSRHSTLASDFRKRRVTTERAFFAGPEY